MGIFIPTFPRSNYSRRSAPRPNAAPEVVQKWKDAHPAEFQWLHTQSRADNDFACSLMGALNRYGSLTEKQVAAVRSSIARDANRAEAAVARMETAPDASFPEVEKAFERAREAGITWPKLTLDVFKFSRAGDRSANPGAIYVKDADCGTYLGKIHHGKFVRSRDCGDDAEAAILRICADPHAAAIAHGKKFGRCSACSRELTDPKSVALSMGPVCAKNYGWSA